MAKKKGGGHHGGAWKVAYADFVTAMMALFMVLWISAQDQKILIATSRYFQTPFNSPMDATSGILPFDSNEPNKSSGKDSAEGQAESSNARDMEMQFLNSVAKDFFRLLNVEEDLGEKPIEVQVSSDGLRITLYDRARRPLFMENTSEFTEWGRFVMQSLAWLIDRHQFRVVIEGHTKKGLVMPNENYTAWELSADRANAARRSLTFYAVDNSLVERVTGYADTRPQPFQPPESEGNQRVTLSLTMRNKTKDEPKKDEKAATVPATASKARLPTDGPHGESTPRALQTH